MQNILFLVHKIGPYHNARFKDLAKSVNLTVVEILPESKEYDWDNIKEEKIYKIIQIKEHKDGIEQKGKQLLNNITEIISTANPQLIINTGWANRSYLAVVYLAKQKKIPVITVSDSTYDDVPRSKYKEKLKQPIINAFDGFIAAGSRSTLYLKTHAVQSPIKTPWDVVDNDYFAQTTDFNKKEIIKKKYQLPDNYLLCVSRYIPKKNHKNLISAYQQAKKEFNIQAKLVFIGCGPLKKEIIQQIQDAQLENDILLFDFIQYDEIPYFYKGSKAVLLCSNSDQWGLVINEALACSKAVLVTNKCGCADDLVEDGKNGWIVNSDVDSLKQGLQKIEETNSDQLNKMGK